MKLTEAKNIFDVQAFPIWWSKVIGLNFISIRKDKFGKSHQETNILDFVRFVIWIFISFSVTMDGFRRPSDINSKRSFLIEFLWGSCGKLGVTRSCFELVYFFCFRYEFFNIFEGIQWIDDQVKNGFFIFCF